jgi:predicted RNA polymerase sigma factor
MLVDALTVVPAMDSYHLLPSVRGDLLLNVGRPDEAGQAPLRSDHG